MQKRWTGQNVDLDSLSDFVEDFFKSRSLSPRTTKTAEERTISWFPRRMGVPMKEPLSVKIVGRPDDFTIDLEASELMDRPIHTGMLTTVFGGGYFLLKAVKQKEQLERLEKEFWIVVEEKIAQLSRSA